MCNALSTILSTPDGTLMVVVVVAIIGFVIVRCVRIITNNWENPS